LAEGLFTRQPLDKWSNRRQSLVKITIYVEGGGDNSFTRTRCREGFARYCEKICPVGKRPRIVACGGRQQTFNRFKTEVELRHTEEHCVLLVDSEGPVSTGITAITHLQNRDGWTFPISQGMHAFLMVQAMEAWLIADRTLLSRFYGQGFRLSALPGNTTNIESIPKNDLADSLATATAATKSKGYHKTKHAFNLLAQIDPAKVERVSEHAARFHEFLRSR
jgi:hypothetical protein